MKNILAIISLLFTTTLFAKTWELSHKGYPEARDSENRLQFSVVSTKLGFLSSTHAGYPLKFVADVSSIDGNFIKGAKLSFKAKSMNTNMKQRDDKLHNEVIKANQNPDVILTIQKPIELGKTKTYPGKIEVGGKSSEFSIELDARKENSFYLVKGRTDLSLRKLGLPDPSIAVAKLKDKISIDVRLRLDQ